MSHSPAPPIVALSTNANLRAIPLDQNGAVADDIVCRKCGYNLRGLASSGVCPECGTAVGRSLFGDFLRYCDPAWVRTLAKGMNWILAGIVVAFVSGCLGGGLTTALRIANTSNLTAWAITLPGSLIALVGYWMVSTRDPARTDEEPVTAARRLVRFAEVFKLLVAPLSILISATIPLTTLPIGIASIVISMVGTISLFVLGRQLALRIPDEKLARSTRRLMWLVITVSCLSIAVTMIGGMVMAAAMTAPGGPASAPAFPRTSVTVSTTSAPVVVATPFGSPIAVGFMATTFGSLILALICLIWGIRLFGAYRRALLEQAATAERVWAGSAGAPVSARPDDLPVAKPST